jgi:protocatechuate 3,4-dioxygenase beta subunit
MRPANQERLLLDVLSTLDGSADLRLQQILASAVRHIHEFVSEVGLTREEWAAGVEFLTAVGQMSTDTRQEFILLSDVLGVSSLVEMIAYNGAPGATDNTVLGPFYIPDSPMREFGESVVVNEDGGPPLVVRGQVMDLEGRPIGGALLDVWQTASNGKYPVQDGSQDPRNLRARFVATTDGRFEFRTIRPVAYPVPDDGPVGRLLRAAGRHPWRPAHVHIMATKDGYQSLTTHVFDADSDYLDSDAVFGVRTSLVTKFEPSSDHAGELVCEFDIVLQPDTVQSRASQG